MLVGGLPYVLVCVSNIEPMYATTIPAFGLVGIGAALLWTGQGVRSALAHLPVRVCVCGHAPSAPREAVCQCGVWHAVCATCAV
jgi:hypothetical protein